MRDTFVKTLIELAKKDSNIILITGDLGFGVLKPFWEQLPDQFINVGIAEQNMTSIAAGIALEGKTVFTYSIGNFPTLRCIEQIRNDCAYHNANVKIVCVGGGFVYGSLGMSHHATEDIALMRSLPDVTVFAPGDATEAAAVTKAIVNQKGTCYLRLGRGSEPFIPNNSNEFSVGKAIKVEDGSHVAIFFTGGIYSEVESAKRILNEKGVFPAIYSFPTVKPLDNEVVLNCADEYDIIVTCEEHNVSGGFGSLVSETLAEQESHARLIRIGIPDCYCHHVGNQEFLRSKYGLDGKGISDRILEALK